MEAEPTTIRVSDILTLLLNLQPVALWQIKEEIMNILAGRTASPLTGAQELARHIDKKERVREVLQELLQEDGLILKLLQELAKRGIVLANEDQFSLTYVGVLVATNSMRNLRGLSFIRRDPDVERREWLAEHRNSALLSPTIPGLL